MKTVIFSEEQLQNLDEIGKKLFGDEHDPRSSAYVRVLNRPTIHWMKIVFHILMPLLVVAALAFLLNHLGLSAAQSIIIAVCVLLAYILIMLKRMAVCLIRIYQRYAPSSLRNRCRFEPSCSEYMLLAIEKYGFFRGFKKGICRLKRCNLDGGGFDYP